MSLKEDFDRAALHAVENIAPRRPKRRKRSAPFSIRFTDAERGRLADEAGDVPLGTYIKTKALGDPLRRTRRTGVPAADKESLGRILALLGRAELGESLRQLAHAASIGILPLTPETESELLTALRDVRDIRRLLLLGLGLKEEITP